MWSVECYEHIMSKILAQANIRLGIQYNIDPVSLENFKQCCAILDYFALGEQIMDLVGYTGNVDTSDTLDVTVGLICNIFSPDPDDEDMLDTLIGNAKKINFEWVDEDGIRIEFVFGGLFKEVRNKEILDRNSSKSFDAAKPIIDETSTPNDLTLNYALLFDFRKYCDVIDVFSKYIGDCSYDVSVSKDLATIEIAVISPQYTVDNIREVIDWFPCQWMLDHLKENTTVEGLGNGLVQTRFVFDGVWQ